MSKCNCIDRTGTTMVECCNQCGEPLPATRWECGPMAISRIAELEAELHRALEDTKAAKVAAISLQEQRDHERRKREALAKEKSALISELVFTHKYKWPSTRWQKWLDDGLAKEQAKEG